MGSSPCERPIMKILNKLKESFNLLIINVLY